MKKRIGTLGAFELLTLLRGGHLPKWRYYFCTALDTFRFVVWVFIIVAAFAHFLS